MKAVGFPILFLGLPEARQWHEADLCRIERGQDIGVGWQQRPAQILGAQAGVSADAVLCGRHRNPGLWVTGRSVRFPEVHFWARCRD